MKNKTIKKSKIKKNQPNGLFQWLFQGPMKFTILFISLIIISVLISGIINTITGQDMTYLAYSLTTASLIFSIYMLVKWLPKYIMDRKSYVAITNITTIAYFLFFLVSVPLLIIGIPYITVLIINFAYNFPIMFFTFITIFFILGMYIMGIMISGTYATYKRGLAMGVPRLKMILSIPFTVFLYALPGYLLDSNKKETPAIKITPAWFNNLTNWITKRTRNAIIAFIIAISLTVMTLQLTVFVSMIVFGIIFTIWILITGREKFVKNIGGAYATYSVAMNIILIIAVFSLPFYTQNQMAKKIVNETIFYNVHEELTPENLEQDGEVINIDISQPQE